MGKNNIIEINGRRYDARTGEPLPGGISHVNAFRRSDSTKSATPPPTKTVPTNDVAGSKPAPKAAPTAAKTRVHDAIKAQPQSRRQQRSKTLMRASVAKPSASLKRHAKVQSHTDALVDKPASRLQPKASAHRVNEGRLRRAQGTTKSQAVARFSQPTGPAPQPPTAVPTPTYRPHQLPATDQPDIPRQGPARATEPASLRQSTAELLEHALQEATSHLEPAPVIRKRWQFWRAAA